MGGVCHFPLSETHFRVSIRSIVLRSRRAACINEIHFDYEMRPGVVETSNVLAVMRKMGLVV
jgi:hypothetical protein